MKQLRYLLSFSLLIGTLFAWTTVVNDFAKFYSNEGTLLKVQDCVIPNPVTTPCFYGAFAFLGAFFWSLIIFGFGIEKQKRHHKFLFWFLIGGNIFAWTNFFIILIRFLQNLGKPIIGCSGQITANPLSTPCFTGSAIFLISLIISFLVFRQNKK